MGCLPIAAPAATGPFEDHSREKGPPVRTTRTRSVITGVVWAITLSWWITWAGGLVVGAIVCCQEHGAQSLKGITQMALVMVSLIAGLFHFPRPSG